MFDLILVSKRGELNVDNIKFKVIEFGKNHYLIYKRVYKNEFYKTIAQYKNSRDIFKSLPNYVQSFESFEKYIKSKNQPI